MILRTDVSALYVDPRGPYPKLVADWWDEKRDARLYAGPNPVVAHPPCGPWGSLSHMRVPNRERRASDVDCMGPAVNAVRTFGGVLEQPAGSKAFAAFGIPLPFTEGDSFGFTVEVEQVNWGHPARKKTWLYCVGISRSVVVAGKKYGAEPTHWVSGGRNPLRKNGRRGGGVVPPGIKVCSAQQRRRTPVAFAEWLIELACAGAARP